MTATMSQQAILDSNGQYRTHGPVILVSHDEIPEGHNLLWNDLAYAEDGRERYGYFTTALRDIVAYMPARKILCMRAIRSLCRGVGYDMSLWEVKITYDAVLDMVLRDARSSLAAAMARRDARAVAVHLELLQRHGELNS